MVISQVIDWIIQNKEWVFSGFGVAIIVFLFSNKGARNYIKAMFNCKSSITQINIEHKDDEKK